MQLQEAERVRNFSEAFGARIGKPPRAVPYRELLCRGEESESAAEERWLPPRTREVLHLPPRECSLGGGDRAPQRGKRATLPKMTPTNSLHAMRSYREVARELRQHGGPYARAAEAMLAPSEC